MPWYELTSKKESKKEYLARVKYDEIICRKARSFLDIVDGELKPNVQYRIITEQGFNAIAVIEYLSEFYELTDVYVAVYRMNLQAVRKLKEFIDDGNIRCNILLSSFFRENRKYESPRKIQRKEKTKKQITKKMKPNDSGIQKTIRQSHSKW